MARTVSVLLFLILWLVSSNHELLAAPDGGHAAEGGAHCDGFTHCDCDCDDGCLLSCETLSLALRQSHDLSISPALSPVSEILACLLTLPEIEQASAPAPTPDSDRRLIQQKTWQFAFRAARNPGAPS